MTFLRIAFLLLAVDSQVAQYDADAPKTILELQQFRHTTSARVRTGAGREGVLTLVDLNPNIGAWYLLSVAWNGAAAEPPWHLENPRPGDARIALDAKTAGGLAIVEGKNRYSCDALDALEQGRKSQSIYYPLCEGRLYLRNPAKGSRTALEGAAEFLRNQVWGGEQIVVMFHHLLADRYRETGDVRGEASKAASTAGQPLPALSDPARAGRLVLPANLGIALESRSAESRGMAPGEWYAAAGSTAIFVSVFEPDFVAPAILASYPKVVSALDRVEASSLCYLIAFDLDQFELGFALGTDHPGVGWSDHTMAQTRNPKLPGPDGIGSIAPLVSTGLIPPEYGRRTVSAFTGGFKRQHGAFLFGELAGKNHGSHYGFIENGVVFSKPQPGLATVFVPADGLVRMKTWAEEDNKLLPGIRYARQNGVPIAEFDAATQSTAPGRLVARWGPGNWSGSENEKLRTIRAGLAMQAANGKRFLVYAVFSDATPSAMARVFQAYRVSYAMPLDMNALEHTYLAVYRRSGSEMSVEHLLKGMSVLDKEAAGAVIPRFLGYPDNRDFFYLMRREKEVKP